ncbi:MAG TPA: alpha-L-rhamnosidase C-terminal domain-containing protein [Armatimonadota bacterium]|nr:alpha-L-rhamnosidase C-terminal domain-containing protein [Armatimonadota bacterium]
MKRIYVDDEVFVNLQHRDWMHRGNWRAWWVDLPDRSLTQPSVALFRLRFTVDEPSTVRIHVSADNRYRLFLDGNPVGRGPERGNPQNWRFDGYTLELSPGEHTLLAQTWWLAENAPFAQMTIRPGFLLTAEDEWLERLSTGIAPWETTIFNGITFISPGVCWGTGARLCIDGTAYPWGWENGNTGDWQPVEKLCEGMSAKYKNEIPPNWLLTPSTLPAMREESQHAGTVRYLTEVATPYPVDSCHHMTEETTQWNEWLLGKRTLTIPAQTTRTAIIDLENYYCAYPKLTVSGGRGSKISLRWAEGLYEGTESEGKGNRNEIAGKYFRGEGDVFIPDGGEDRAFSTLWWEAGRYLELRITTGDEPLDLIELSLATTGYPLQMEGHFTSSDTRLDNVIPIALRALQMCSHETFMDCPYYEQLMYVGDTRLEALTTYVMMRDDRLPRKALVSFDESRRLCGFTQSRYPSKITQIIPPFSLWWVCMVHDYLYWRNGADFVQQRLPGVRAVMEAFRQTMRDDGLLGVPNGWNFTDWVPGWVWGVPPKAEVEPSSILNMQFALTLVKKAEMEEYFGEQELAERDRKLARSICEQVLLHFWNESRGLIADDLAQTQFSEHAQCIALLSGLLTGERKQRIADGLLHDESLARTTIYFTHYLFETYYQLGCAEQFIERLAVWFDLEKYGFTTTFEAPEPSRSDCHAWGAHPVYHYYASILGIRPLTAGFAQIRIAPLLGPLTHVDGVLPHPAGEVRVLVDIDNGTLNATINLPESTTGVFVWQGIEIALSSGQNTISLPTSRSVVER